MNTARPIVAGGTGATTALGALKGLGAVSGTPIVSGGSANAHTLSTGQSYSSYAEPMSFLVVAGNTNTGATTVNVDTIGTKNLKMFYNGAIGDPPAGAIVQNAPYLWAYDETNDYFLSINMTLVSAMLASNLQYFAGLTPATDKLPFFDTATSMAVTDFSNFAQTLLGNGSNTVMRTTLDVDSKAEVTAKITATRFTSAAQTITSGGSTGAIAHGLGAIPGVIYYRLICNDAGGDAGYAQNDEIVISGHIAPRYNTALVDATNITVRFSDQTNAFATGHKTTGAATALTNSKWDLYIEARL